MTDDALSIEEFESLVGGRVESIEPIGASVPLSKEFLLTEIENLKRQRTDAQSTVWAATGAIKAYEALVEKIEHDEAEAAKAAQAPEENTDEHT